MVKPASVLIEMLFVTSNHNKFGFTTVMPCQDEATQVTSMELFLFQLNMSQKEESSTPQLFQVVAFTEIK